jgi:hypothetical protein
MDTSAVLTLFPSSAWEHIPARRDSASEFITGSRAFGKRVTKQSLVTRKG